MSYPSQPCECSPTPTWRYTDPQQPFSDAHIAIPTSPDLRRSSRPKTESTSYSPSNEWSKREKERIGKRHDSTRDESYEELQQTTQRMRTQLTNIAGLIQQTCKQLDSTLNEFPQPLHAAVAAMQTALVELMDDESLEIEVGGGPHDVTASTSVAHVSSISQPSTCASSINSDLQSTKKPVETKRFKIGRELQEALKKVVALKAKGKTKEASTLLSAAPAGKVGASVAKERARELLKATFSFGDFDITSEAVGRFVCMPEVKLLLEKANVNIDGKKAEKDLETAKLLLNAAKNMFTKILAVEATETNKVWVC